METLSVLQSLIMALWVAAIMSRWLGGGATLTLRFIMTGLVAGLVMGDVESDDCHRSITNDLHGCFHQVALCQQNHQLRQRLLCQCVAREFEAGSGYCRSGSCRSFRKLFISIPFLY